MFFTGMDLELEANIQHPPPDGVPRGEFRPVKINEGLHTVTAVDLESTGLSKA